MTAQELIFDIDGVTANLHPIWIGQRYNQAAGDTLDWTTIRTWGLEDYVKPEWQQKVYELLDDPTLYDAVPPMVGARECVRQLRELGHTVYFATSATALRGRKLAWLIEHGFLAAGYEDRQYYIEIDTRAKHLLRGDLLVDDHPPTVRRSRCTRRLLFSQPYNARDDLPRVLNWHEILLAVKD